MNKTSFVFILLMFSVCTCYSVDTSAVDTSEAVVEPPSIVPKFCPQIPKLSSRDPIFIQFSQDVEQWAIDERTKPDSNHELAFYTYIATKDDTLFSIASRCCLRYETIAGVNSIESTQEHLEGKTLYLPTGNGIFYPKEPSTSVEILLFNKYIANENKKCYIIGSKVFYFLKDERLSATERAFFLDTNLKLPLEDGILSSSFGMRISPISGSWKFHEGIDLAAPLGTKVYACKRGVVIQSGYDSIYGNFIVVQHDQQMQSKYAHLSEIKVTKDEVVATGQLIGLVGMTGAATGYHLHFEIRMNGVAIDPNSIL